MRAHPEKRLLYLPHPRTASVATETWMDAHGWVDPAPDLNKHAPLSVLREHTGQMFEKWSVATTVRHHFDALVSWSFVEQSHLPFDTDWLDRFMEACIYVEQSALYPLHLDASDRVLRYESLESDLSEWVGVDVSLPVMHESEGRTGRLWRDFYDEALTDAVLGRFGREFRALGYSL